MTERFAPDKAAIERLAQAAIERLPAPFRAHLGDVLLRVVDFPDDEVIATMDLASEWDILGLYAGRPVGSDGAGLTGALPDTIHLYRQPILLEWIEGDDSLEALVTNVVVHEIGHHFGLSDAAMHALESTAD